MATLREYFDTDCKTFGFQLDWNVSGAGGGSLPPIAAKIAFDFEANAKYLIFFIPPGVDAIRYTHLILVSPRVNRCTIDASEGDAIEVVSELAGYDGKVSSKELLFTSRIFLYVDTTLTDEERKSIVSAGAEIGLSVVTRDRGYALQRAANETPLAFISHDSKDKDSLVRELATSLSSLGCPVWYDEFSLRVGDSLRASIERGLKEAAKCIVVLSPNFLANGGWGKAEFDSIFTREIFERRDVILPVWHNVTAQQVYEYSPRLADKVGLNSNQGVPELAMKLAAVLR